MQDAYNEVLRLVCTNATHRKGFRLLEISEEQPLNHAIEEIRELLNAKPEEKLDELADAFGCLLHYAVRRGFTLPEIERAMLQKFKVRFTPDNDRRPPQ